MRAEELSVAGGRLGQRPDPLSHVLRRVVIVFGVAIVAGSWYAVTAYARAHRRQETADERAQQCSLIEDQGEDYYGELADCRNRLAYLRAVERR
jgi:hypothetical protein